MVRHLFWPLLLTACAAPPQSAPGAGSVLAEPFRSSQIKPPPPAREPLPPAAHTSQRAALRQSLLQQGRPVDPTRKAQLLTQSAASGPGSHDLHAGPLALLPLTLAAGQPLTLETRGASPGSDPVLHLWSRDQGREVAMDDDSGAEPWGARLQLRAPHSGRYLVLLRAYASGDGGRCDLLLDGAPALQGARFGGSTLRVQSGLTLETVRLNDGQGQAPWPATPRAARDTLLLLLGEGGTVASLDDDSGVELSARLQLPEQGTQRVWLGALSPAEAGTSRLVLNDRLRGDSDGDGLGDGLEQRLGLCHRRDAVVQGYRCDRVPSAQDSDGDGLSDAAEVLGLDHPLFPQLLPRWGVDPRHRDLLLEIDLAHWSDTEVNPPVKHRGRTLSAADAHAAARVYARLTGMHNPDGQPGIALHLDIGAPCGVQASGIDGVCGALCAWGADGQRRCGQSPYPGPPAARRDGLAPGRRHLFHVAVADCLVAGQAPGGPADHLEYDCDRFTALVHELGHNLGLNRHYGTVETGGGNCKPNYPSLMNYAYADRFADGVEVRFSDGSLVGQGDLDPARLDETRPLPGSAAQLSWLAGKPFYFPLHCGPGGCRVDWNRDGQLDPSVRAFLSPMPNYGYVCENLHGNVLDTENLPGLQVSSGPAAAELTLHEQAGVPGPSAVVVAPAHTAAGASRLWLTHSNQGSGGWSEWAAIPGPALSARAQPAAATVPSGSEEQLLIVACTDGPQPLRVARFDARGQLTPLSPLPGQPQGLRARDVSLARSGTDLLLVLRDSADAGGDRVYSTRWSPGGWSGAFSPVLAEGLPLRSTVTPALAAGPDGRIYLVTGDPAPPPGTGPSGRLHLYGGLELSALQDLELWGVGFADGVPTSEHVPWSRPAMAFVPHLDGEGQPLPGKRGYLAIWWTRGTRTRHLWTWGRLDQSGAEFQLGRWHHYEAMGYTDAIPGSGPALLLRRGRRLSAFLGQADRFPYLVRHVPYADGIPEPTLVLRDFDDRPVIRANLCTSLNWDCRERCQRLSEPCAADAALQTQRLPLRSCQLPRPQELP